MVFTSLRVVAGVKEKRGWFATNMSDELTVLDVYQDYVSGKIDGKQPHEEIQSSRITAMIGTSKSDLSTEIDLGTKLSDAIPCLGHYIEFRVNLDENENVESPKMDALKILMDGANKACHLPKLKHELNQKNKLYNDIIEWLKKQGVGFLSTNADSLGVNLVNTLCDALWFVDGNHVTLASRACSVPLPFSHFQGYYKPELRKRKKIDSENLKENVLRSHATAILLLSNNGFLKREKWASVREVLSEFGNNLKRYADFLVSEKYKSESRSSKRVFQGDKERWEYTSAARSINPTNQARYQTLHTAIIHSDAFTPIVVNDHSPGEPNRRFEYMKGMVIPVKCCKFTYTGSKENLVFIWKVPVDMSESDLLSKNMNIACELRKTLPVYHSRAMRREFLSLFGRCISNKAAFLREAYRRLTGDRSASLTFSQTEIDQRVSEILDNEDTDLICDLRSNNTGQPEKFNVFLSECQNYINEKLELAVDDRRHDQIDKGDVITHLADAFSVRDLYEQVKAKLPKDTPIPSQQWLRWQFWPRHANFQSSHRYSGKLKVKFMIQSRQFRKSHIDMHYASAIFRHQKEFAIKYKTFCNMVCMDDKHKLKVGEPGYPVATVERGKQVIVAMGKKFEVADHDFTKFSFTPSVNLFSDIPDEIENTFYGGKVFVGLKETAFQPSSPWRHAAELCKILKNSFSEDECIKPIFVMYSDGGPDHRLTYVSVQMSLLCIFLIFDLDMICVARTPPQNSWKNPAERIMSVLNLGFQSVGLMREKTDNYEKQIESANSLSDIRNLAEKFPTFESEVLDAVENVRILLSKVIGRLKWKDESLQVFEPATEAEIVDMRREIQRIDPDLKATDTTQKDVKKRKKFTKFVDDHCKVTHYMFSVKKCGKSSCTVCKKPRLPDQIFETLYHLPDPEPLNADKYKSFEELYGKQTTEKVRPSYTAKPSNLHGIPFSPSSQYAKNVEMVVLCSECDKPRVLYSKKVVKGAKRTQLVKLLAELSYSCGASFDELELAENHVLKTVFFKKNLTCNCTIEIPYYSAGFERVCFYCGTNNIEDEEEGDVDAQKFYPLCIVCKEKGNKLVEKRTRNFFSPK